MRAIWVIGSGGLLGSSLSRQVLACDDLLYAPTDKLNWSDVHRLHAQLEVHIAAFAELAGAATEWEVYWAAGIGTMGSSDEALVRETETLREFLRMMACRGDLLRMPGSLGFASSAGAIYAGVDDGVINETTPVAPTTPYARAKLHQEDVIASFAAAHQSVRVLMARFSTLYGAGQASTKQQGLITHIARSIVRNEPVHIFVPLDTIRDYIMAADAALRMISTMRNISFGKQITKIIASERATTIAEIVSNFNRVARRRPRIVTSANQQSALYRPRMQFHSTVLPEPAPLSSTSLLVGIAQLLEAERARFVIARSS